MLRSRHEKEATSDVWIVIVPREGKRFRCGVKIRTTKELEQSYSKLRGSLEAGNDADETGREELERIMLLARSEFRTKWWLNRFVLGFGVGKAVDEWFQAFDNNSDSVGVLDRIPRDETSNLAAKWAWFNLVGVVVASFISFSVAILTIFFLTRQIDELRESNNLTRESHDESISVLHLTHLYSHRCKNGKCESETSPALRAKSADSYFKLQNYQGNIPKFRGAFLSDSDLSSLDFTGSNFQRAFLNSSTVDNTVFSDVDLSEVEAYRINGKNTVFHDANLTSGRFADAELLGASFEGACVVDADFDRAKLNNSSFDKSILVRANFRGSNLSRASFVGAIIIEANFESAIGITLETFKHACVDSTTKLPKKISVEACPIRTPSSPICQ